MLGIQVEFDPFDFCWKSESLRTEECDQWYIIHAKQGVNKKIIWNKDTAACENMRVCQNQNAVHWNNLQLTCQQMSYINFIGKHKNLGMPQSMKKQMKL